MLLSGPKGLIMEVARYSKGKVNLGQSLRVLEAFGTRACLGFIFVNSTVSLEEFCVCVCFKINN